jgi:hypothetical protein
MMRTRGLALLLVLIVGGAVGYWSWPWTGPTAGQQDTTAANAGRGGQGGSNGVSDIRLELLERERGELTPPERNPFRFERRASATPPLARQARRAQPVEIGPTEPPPPPPPPPIPLRYIGYLQPVETKARVAVLSDGRGNVFNGKEGDVIEGRYRLLRVGDNSADLIYLDGRGRQTIRLSGQ